MLPAMGREAGGALAKVLVALLIVVVLAAGGIVAYVESTDAIRSGSYTVGGNAATGSGTGDPPTFRLARGGEIYVATTLVNDGRFPIRIEGLGEPGDVGQVPYIAREMRLGDGSTAGLGGTSLFHSVRLSPGSGVGVVIVFGVNPDLVCKLFPEEPGETETTYESAPVKYTTLLIGKTDDVGFGSPLFVVDQPTRSECEAATGATS
jgi:hypothetical protein